VYVGRAEVLESLAAARQTLTGGVSWATRARNLARRFWAWLLAQLGSPRLPPAHGEPIAAGDAAALLVLSLGHCPARAGAVSPAAVVRAFYAAWQAVAEQAARAGTGIDPAPLLLHCTGAAAANLARNIAAINSGGARVLAVDAEVVHTQLEGHLASVTVKKSTLQLVGGRVARVESTSVLRLRLTPDGWRIYR
jgi:hypothetical protein